MRLHIRPHMRHASDAHDASPRMPAASPPTPASAVVCSRPRPLAAGAGCAAGCGSGGSTSDCASGCRSSASVGD